MLKKMVSFLVMVAVLSMSMTALGAPSADYPWIYEDFEDSTLNGASYNNGSITYAPGGAEGSKGAGKVKVTQDYGAIRYTTSLKVGQKYRLSAMIKMADAEKVPGASYSYSQFIFNHRNVADTAYRYNLIRVNGTHSSSEWVKFETEYTFDGQGTISGTTREDVVEACTLELRIGSGKPEMFGGASYEYYIDDLIAEPVVTAEGDIVKGGGFESETLDPAWSNLNGAVTTLRTTGGANGTSGYAEVTMTDTTKYGMLRQTIPLKNNRAYKISFYYKAKDSAAVGKNFSMILQWYKAPNSVYLTQPIGTLTDSWQKAEVSVPIDQVAAKDVDPFIYFRSGTGKELHTYCIDEIEAVAEVQEQVPQMMNLDISGDLVTGKTLAVSGQFTGGTEGSSFFRVLQSEDKVNWATVKSEIKSGGSYTYEVTEANKGKYLKFQVLPIDSLGNPGPVAAYVTSTKVVPLLDIGITPDVWNAASSEISANVTVDYNGTGIKDVLVIIALYDEVNTFLNVNSEYQEVSAGTPVPISVSIAANENAAKAKVFVWEGKTLGDTNCMPYVKYKLITKQ